MKTAIGFLSLGLALAAVSCSSANYAFWDMFGVEKRHILVDRVEEAIEEQEEAKEEFKTTLERFKELSNFKGGDLEAMYEKIAASYEDCEQRAEAVEPALPERLALARRERMARQMPVGGDQPGQPEGRLEHPDLPGEIRLRILGSGEAREREGERVWAAGFGAARRGGRPRRQRQHRGRRGEDREPDQPSHRSTPRTAAAAVLIVQGS